MPEVKEQILKYGFLPLQNRSVDELKDFVKSEIARWGKVVQRRRHRRLAIAEATHAGTSHGRLCSVGR